MFLIFGYGPRTKDLGLDIERDCPNCHNRRQWHRIRETNWVTLFFIPVIPTGSKQKTLCPVCNFGYEE